MKNFLKLLIIFYLIPQTIFAQSLTDLGTLGGDDSIARAISDDKTIIVGSSNIANSESRAFSFENNVMTNLGTLGGNFSNAIGISGNGLVITGSATNLGGDISVFKYENGSMTDIGTLGGSQANGNDLSFDGSVIVGSSQITGNIIVRAFKYEGSTMTDIGTLGGTNSSANAVSEDGLIIVGHSEITGDGAIHAFKYEGSTMTDLGTLGGTDSRAFNISSDGSIIVGNSQITGDGAIHAFKYQNNIMTDLGTLGGTDSSANAVSEDGLVIVGESHITGDGATHAFKYQNGSMIDLGTLGGTNSYATAVSKDGRVIVGYSDTSGGDSHAFMAINNLVDVNNTISVLSNNANQLNSVLNLSESLVNYSLNQDAKLFGENGLHLGFGARLASVDKSREAGSIFKFAYRLNENLRTGIFLDYGFADNLPNNFETKRTAPMVSIFTVLSENEEDLGLSLRLAASYNSSNLDITRSTLANTEAGSGRTDLVSKGALAQLGYGFKINNNSKFQPYIGIRFSEISRKAYIETSQADFPITFAEAKKRSTSALIGANLELSLSKKLSTRFGAGLERDLSASLDGYSGEISYLGSFDLTPRAIREKRYFVSTGASYRIAPTQEVAFDVTYSKQSLASSDAIIGFVNYAIGF